MNSSLSERAQWQPQARNHRAQAVAHLVKMAMTPGMWLYAQQRALDMEHESVQHGLWTGIRADVRQELKARGFRLRHSESQRL